MAPNLLGRKALRLNYPALLIRTTRRVGCSPSTLVHDAQELPKRLAPYRMERPALVSACSSSIEDWPRL